MNVALLLSRHAVNFDVPKEGHPHFDEVFWVEEAPPKALVIIEDQRRAGQSWLQQHGPAVGRKRPGVWGEPDQVTCSLAQASFCRIY